MKQQDSAWSERQGNDHNESRREFIGKAAVSAPVLAAFISKPSWSIDNNCISSGTLSGNLSNHGCQALARDGDWWANNLILWNSNQIPGVIPSTEFRAIFGTNPLARLDSNDKYYTEGDNGENTYLTIGIHTSIEQILQGITTSKPPRRSSDVDKAVVAAYLNMMHPGIAYQGYADVNELFVDYTTALNNYLVSYDNSIFDELYTKLEGANGYNNNLDQQPGV